MIRSTTVTGSVNFACGRRIRYDDTLAEHRTNRLHRTSDRPSITCPTHGPEMASCAVSGPAKLLWPDRQDYADVMWDLYLDHQVVD